MTCPECNGELWIEQEVIKPHNFNRDVGFIDTEWMRCERCNQQGEIEDE